MIVSIKGVRITNGQDTENNGKQCCFSAQVRELERGMDDDRVIRADCGGLTFSDMTDKLVTNLSAVRAL